MTPSVQGPMFSGTMPVTIPSTALMHLSDAERARLLDAAFDPSPEALNNYLLVLRGRLRAFERRYELPTTELQHALETGSLRETADVSEWLFWSDLWSHLARETRA